MILGFGAAFGVAHAQVPASFERVYGNDCGDGGARGIAPVFNCTTGGYIATGMTQSDLCGKPDVYVVRTKPDGTLLWAKGYDINGANEEDYGKSIVECADGSGFVVVGNTRTPQNPPSIDAFVMKIDCDGRELWTLTFGDNVFAEFANDVVEAPAAGGGANDIVVVGSRHQPGVKFSHDGWVARITSAGVPIWESTYNTGTNIQEQFYGVTITTVAPNAGDIVAVGLLSSAGPRKNQGLMVRLTAAGAPSPIGGFTGAAEFGGANREVFNSVIELQNGAEAGNLVAIGETEQIGSVDLFMVKTRPNPCDPAGALAEVAIGNTSDAYGPINDYGADLFEVTAAYPLYGGPGGGGALGTAVGDIVITGYNNESVFYPATGTPYHHNNVLMLAVHPTLLTSVPQTGRLFGSDLVTGDHEWGHSIAEVTGTVNNDKGIIICATSYSNLPHLPLPNGPDLYLIKTDFMGRTGCEDTWAPPITTMATQLCVLPDPKPEDLDVEAEVVEHDVEITHEVCPRPFPKINRDGGDELSDISDAIHTYPNPILRGGMLMLTYAADAPAEVSVMIVDELGESVMRWSTAVVAGDNRIEVTTEDLPAGTYTVTIDDGVEPRHARIVVVGGR